MKKSTLFLACCKKDPIAPTIGISNGSGYVTENAQMYSGDEITVGFDATGEDLTKLEVTLSANGTILTTHFENIEKQESYSYSHTFTLDANGTVTITGTVTDAAGQTASKSFNVYCEEKPNAKFVGRYHGNALSTGNLHANINGMEPIDEEFTDRETPIVLQLEAGTNINEVVGTCTFEDRSVDCIGTIEGNMVTFETINDVITFNYDMGGFNVSPQLNVTYNIKGTLTDGQLVLDGTCKGNGDINLLFIYSGTVEMDATVGGSLIKE